MQPVKPYQETVGMVADVLMVVAQDFAEEEVFGFADGFDDEAVVLGVIE